MRFKTKRILSAATALGLCLLVASGATGQAAQDPKPQMAETVFKNVQILKGIPVDEFMDTMGMFSASLSLNCIDCHTTDSVATWDNFAKETPLKRTSRRMMTMVKAINKDNFGTSSPVTCYTCHRGDTKPKLVPNLAAQYAEYKEDPNDLVFHPIPGGPTVDQILDKYIQALGGAQRLAGVTSFTGKGTFIGFETELEKVPMDIYAKAPNLRAIVVHTKLGDSTRVYDGKAGWIASPDRPVGLLPLTGGNLDGAKLDAILGFPTQLKQAFSQWKASATDIDGAEVKVLQGVNGKEPPVNFYFNEAGLLVRVLRMVDTAVGRVPTQVDYSDYRDVSGVKMPFHWTVTWTNGQTNTDLTEIRMNAPVDAARLSRPSPAARPK